MPSNRMLAPIILITLIYQLTSLAGVLIFDSKSIDQILKILLLIFIYLRKVSENNKQALVFIPIMSLMLAHTVFSFTAFVRLDFILYDAMILLCFYLLLVNGKTVNNLQFTESLFFLKSLSIINISLSFLLYSMGYELFLDYSIIFINIMIFPPVLGYALLLLCGALMPSIGVIKIMLLLILMLGLLKSIRFDRLMFLIPAMITASWLVVFLDPEYFLLDLASLFTNPISANSRYIEFLYFNQKMGLDFIIGNGLGFAFDLDQFRSQANLWDYGFATWEQGHRARINHYIFTWIGNRFGLLGLIVTVVISLILLFRVSRLNYQQLPLAVFITFGLIEITLNFTNGASSFIWLAVAHLSNQIRAQNKEGP